MNFEHQAPTPEEVTTMLQERVPGWRDNLPVVGQITPLEQFTDENGALHVTFKVEDEANPDFCGTIALPAKFGQQLIPEFACCEGHHEIARARVARSFAAPFN